MGTQGTGRKRSTKKERSTAEDDALNLIAREAEARLAAKRAARAEAREIRMKELERQQKEIFQVQKKYYGLNTKSDDRVDSKWGDIEQWMEDSERYSRSLQIHTLSDDDERLSMGSRGSVRSDADALAACGGAGSPHKKSKKKKKHKHKDRDKNGYDDYYSVISSRSSRLSDESKGSRSSRLDLTSSRLSDDSRVSRASRVDLQPASYASSDLYSFNGLSSRNPGSTFNGYKSSLYEGSPCSGSRLVSGSVSHPLEYTSYRSSSSRASSRASSARASPVDNCSSVASYLRSKTSSNVLPRDLDNVTIPDFTDQLEDKDYLEKGSRAASILTTGTLTTSGGTSSRRGSGETAITVDAETSIREIKDVLAEMEEKYRKAMVSNAQLDNEKTNLMYQVDTLKDSLMELEELLSESRREFEEKVKEYEREKHAHSVLQFQFKEVKETLKQSEELLNEIRQLRIKQDGFVREISDLQETLEWKDKKIGALERQKEYTDAIRIERDELREEVVKLKDILKKHGIVLGPDLNINGDIGEAEVDGLPPSGDSVPNTAQDSQTSPTEGNSMLGNTEEIQLRSSAEEEVEPEQQQEMLKEEPKENHLSFDTHCNIADESTLKTSSEEQPIEKQQTCLPKEEDSIGDNVLSKDLNVDINGRPVTEAECVISKIICSPELGEILTSAEESVPERETAQGADLGEPSKSDLGEKEVKSGGVETQSDDSRGKCRKLFEEQECKQEVVEESNLRITESCPQQKGIEDVMKETLPESVSAESNPEPQQELENVIEAENDEIEEPSRSQPQGASATGKKKKRKRRGKKKGFTHEDKHQHKDGTEKQNSIEETDVELIKGDNWPKTEPNIDSSVTETFKELKMDHIEITQDRQETEDVATEVRVEPTESFSHKGALNEPNMEHVTNEHEEEQSLETKTVQEVEASLKIPYQMETTKESRIEPTKDEQDKEQLLQIEKVEEVDSLTSPSDANLSASDVTLILNIEDTDNKEFTSSVDDPKFGDPSNNGEDNPSEPENVHLVENEVGCVEQTKPECTTNNSSFETNSIQNTETESHNSSNGDITADQSEESNDFQMLSLKGLSHSESPPGPEEATGTVKEPGVDTEREGSSPSVSCHGDHQSEFNQDTIEKEKLTGNLRESEDLIEIDSSLHEEEGDTCDSATFTKNTELEAEECLLEPVAQAEQFCEIESQRVMCIDQTDEYHGEVSLETKAITTTTMSSRGESSREVSEIGFPVEQESAAVEDSGQENCKNYQENEKSIFLSAEQLHESSKDKSENHGSNPPSQHDSDEDENEQSFDFDDIDMEAAIASNPSGNPQQEEVEDGVEVMSDEGNIDSSGLCQSNTEPHENTQDKTVDDETDVKCLVEDSNRAGTLAEESSIFPQDSKNTHEEADCEKEENVCEEQVNTQKDETNEADEASLVTEEGKGLSVVEHNATSLDVVEEGLDVIQHEMQDKDLLLPKIADQGTSNKESPESGKDLKKNSKKGKGKSREECKMS
ncbi:putative leucine-rich repeat-containing protein DDB_G0290503 isoform X7 [Channa argus]|uniref:putative leucine-rich repeat-containing protein DDB_G0290503 isoform X7 n=1 Tax=Channa argus TaxID=215402 RepID=UPI003521D7AD